MRLEGKKILAADDEARLTQLMSIYLEKEGAVVLTAADGEAAFKAATLNNPDLIVMDLNMPGTNGLEAIRSLRIIMEDKPILVLTGYATDETFRSAIEAGADRCIAKPPRMDEVVELMAEMIDGKD